MHKYRAALIEFLDTSDWRDTVALTLNLKQSINTPDGGFVMIDELAAKAAFKRYMNALNREVYGHAHRRYGKSLRVRPVLEKSRSGRWHYHVLVEPPEYMTDLDFAETAMRTWRATDAGYGKGSYRLKADRGWTEYMAKFATKGDFAHYFDCIDISSFH